MDDIYIANQGWAFGYLRSIFSLIENTQVPIRATELLLQLEEQSLNALACHQWRIGKSQNYKPLQIQAP